MLDRQGMDAQWLKDRAGINASLMQESMQHKELSGPAPSFKQKFTVWFLQSWERERPFLKVLNLFLTN